MQESKTGSEHVCLAGESIDPQFRGGVQELLPQPHAPHKIGLITIALIYHQCILARALW